MRENMHKPEITITDKLGNLSTKVGGMSRKNKGTRKRFFNPLREAEQGAPAGFQRFLKKRKSFRTDPFSGIFLAVRDRDDRSSVARFPQTSPFFLHGAGNFFGFAEGPASSVSPVNRKKGPFCRSLLGFSETVTPVSDDSLGPQKQVCLLHVIMAG